MENMIRIAIAGVGNCASALIQGIYYYGNSSDTLPIGLMHSKIGGYGIRNMQIVAAFDVDQRKVGQDVSQAIFAKPNCTTVFQPDVPHMGVRVRMSPVLDGVAPHMADVPSEYSFVVSDAPQPSMEEVVDALLKARAHVLVSYLPVGSQKATEFYAECALKAGCGFVNNIPVFIASNPQWARRFEEAGLPVVGDDIKSQFGATIVHRVLTDLIGRRGAALDRTYQLNTGGNTDFLNMLARDRLASKKESKTEAVQSMLKARLEDVNIHVGPSDYVPWQKDNKVCFIRMEARIFGDVPINLELRLSVEDSPNSAGVSVDAIRCCKLAMDRGLAGPILAPSAYFFKHPPQQYPDSVAYEMMEKFIEFDGDAVKAPRVLNRSVSA